MEGLMYTVSWSYYQSLVPILLNNYLKRLLCKLDFTVECCLHKCTINENFVENAIFASWIVYDLNKAQIAFQLMGWEAVKVPCNNEFGLSMISEG